MSPSGSLFLTAGVAAAVGFAAGVAYVDGGFERATQRAVRAWESFRSASSIESEAGALSSEPVRNGGGVSSSKGMPHIKAGASAFAVAAGANGAASPPDAPSTDLTPENSLPSTPMVGSRAASDAGSAAGAGEKLKMAIVVIDDAAKRWGPGKLAIMISSATLGLYKRVYKNRTLRPTLLTWEANHKASKVVLRAPDEAGLGALMDAARAAGIPCHALLEASRGGGGARSRAIVALGPAPHSALAAAGLQALPSL